MGVRSPERFPPLCGLPLPRPHLHDVGMAEAGQNLHLLVHTSHARIALSVRRSEDAHICQRQLLECHQHVPPGPPRLVHGPVRALAQHLQDDVAPHSAQAVISVGTDVIKGGADARLLLVIQICHIS